MLEKLSELCASEKGEIGLQNAAIAARNGAVELLCSLCSSLENEEDNSLVLALKALSSVLCGL